MKIVYIHAPSAVGTSVHRKILNQVRALIELGHDVHAYFFVLSKDAVVNPESSLSKYVRYIEVRPVSSSLFRSLRNLNKVHKSAVSILPEIPSDAIVFLRYPKATPQLWNLARRLKKRLVIEHVTNEVDEIKLFLSSEQQGGLVSRALGRLQFYTLPILFERIFGSLIRRSALLGLCNSSEISRYQVDLAMGEYATLVVGDSVWVEDLPIAKATIVDDEFRMIFLKGSSSVHDYNGLDRVIRGMANYKGSIKLKLFLFGHQLEQEKKLVHQLGLHENVLLGGPIDYEDQAQLFDSVHLGISALAVHRKGIRATTTIKSREYCARGVPFIYAYHDPDFEEDYEGALKLEMSDEPVGFENVIAWYLKIDIKTIRNSMRAFALEELHFRSKMKNVVERIEAIRQP